jgi:signal transduction histidine kinase
LKFKFLFLFFNCIIVVFLLIVLFMPMIILGGDYLNLWDREFWISLWPLLAILAIFLIILDIYYVFNRKLFRLLEREDWPALLLYLDTRFLRRGRYSGLVTRLFVNACLIMSDFRAVMDLENKLKLLKPALVERNALAFGVAYILAKDYGGALRFFAAHARGFPEPGNRFLRALPFFNRDRSKQWLAWYHGFSMLLDKRFMEAAEKFRLLAREARDPVVAALSAWFLSDNLSKVAGTSFLEEANTARERIRGVLKGRKEWEEELARIETEIYAAIMRRYINEAGNWIYQT